eukprot:CAMPEP_0171308642 /NCGR_PEP_ID=MMETSP0816-20121228/18732_1 /TAXON_ID=420281 /ORGANISM="Proboscia inermis, Strain CCAP1064/1" /LENGTH=53 /DNA_ID=CAMNT_0011791637 /DNA_START=971 /DNA_END=1132 /DNA_ORIENTATION=+
MPTFSLIYQSSPGESDEETVVDDDYDSIVELSPDEAEIIIEGEIILSATILST